MIRPLRHGLESIRPRNGAYRESTGVARQSTRHGGTSEPGPQFTLSQAEGGTLVVKLRGDWKLKGGLPAPGIVEQQLNLSAQPRSLAFDTSELAAWDSGLIAFLSGLQELCRQRKLEFDTANLPEGARRLLKLAAVVAEIEGTRRIEAHHGFFMLVGLESIALWRSMGDMLSFLGQALESFGRLAVGRARFRRRDLIDTIFECGAAALPIITLISFLVGLILAFVGAVQLALFGAQIYVADLVGIAMAREMGALMTAIIMSGRTGAAFAAHLGTMQVNEEIDALTTFGLSPMDFLVLPRMIALILMMPLLCIYADLMGILGGAVVGTGMLKLSAAEYLNQTVNGIGLTDFGVGIFKSAVFGVLVAIAGCMRGIQCGRSALAVGQAATSAVVTAIVFLILTDGIFAILTNALGI
jgi:phospholipid/cholesterol/gamma-HCH transport system permease protein